MLLLNYIIIMEILYMDEEKKLLNYYVMLKNNGNGVDIFLDELLKYFESSKDVDRNNVMNVLLYLKNGE